MNKQKRFFTYKLEIKGELVYYGEGSDNYGDGRGRLEEHRRNQEMWLRGTYKGNFHIYSEFGAKIKEGKWWVSVIISWHATKLEALAAEEKLIEEHPKLYPGVRMLNEDNKGIRNNTKLHKKMLGEPVDIEGLRNQQHRFYWAEKSAEFRGNPELARELRDHRKKLPKSDVRMRTANSVRYAVRKLKEEGLEKMAEALYAGAYEAPPLEAKKLVDAVNVERRINKLLVFPAPVSGQKRENFIGALHHNVKRMREHGFHGLAAKLEKKISDVKGLVLASSKLMRGPTAEKVKMIQENPEWMKLSWDDLALKLGTSAQNARRIALLTGLEKTNAWATKTDAAYEKFISNAAVHAVLKDGGLKYETLEVETGLSRMTIFRFLKRAGYVPKQYDRTSENDTGQPS